MLILQGYQDQTQDLVTTEVGQQSTAFDTNTTTNKISNSNVGTANTRKMTQEEWSEELQTKRKQFGTDLQNASSKSERSAIRDEHAHWVDQRFKIEPRVNKHFVDRWLEKQDHLERIKSDSAWRDWKEAPEWLEELNEISRYWGESK